MIHSNDKISHSEIDMLTDAELEAVSDWSARQPEPWWASLS